MKWDPRWIALSQRDAKTKSRSDRIRVISRLCVRHRVRRTPSTLACIGAAIVSILSMSTLAQEAPTITVSKGDKINLTVSAISGSDGANVTKTLQNDLLLSGYFVLSGNAAYT